VADQLILLVYVLVDFAKNAHHVDFAGADQQISSFLSECSAAGAMREYIVGLIKALKLSGPICAAPRFGLARHFFERRYVDYVDGLIALLFVTSRLLRQDTFMNGYEMVILIENLVLQVQTPCAPGPHVR
jgi:hypothetical protein